MENGSSSFSSSPSSSSSASSKHQARRILLLASSCSICLEAIPEESCQRSVAKLKCGHCFHLDCIGSSFNAKGRMQCPNCCQEEQGQWLYANGCCSNDEFFDDFSMEEGAEVYGGATTLQFMPTPWCPYFSLTLEGFDNSQVGYMDPVVNLRRGSHAPIIGDHICPYLTSQGLPIGQLSPHFEESLGFHNGHHSTDTNRPTSSHSILTNSRQHRVSEIHNSTSTIYERFSRNFHGSHQQYNLGDSHSHHGGIRILGNTFSGQLMHMHNFQHINYNYANANRVWQTPSSQMVPLGWRIPEILNAYNTSVAGINWMTSTPLHNQVDPWMAQVYQSQVSTAALSNWWPWVPHGNSNLSQISNTYQNDANVSHSFPDPTSSLP